MAKKILAGCLAAVILTGLAWYAGFLHSEKRAEKEQSELWQELESLAGRIAVQEERQTELKGEAGEEKTEVSVDPEGVVNEQDSHEYILVEENGRVTIYRIDGTPLYEYTGIAADSLPETLREEISHGKRISGEKELYDFLENYSS